VAGFFKRTEDGDWDSFTPLPSAPNLEWNDPDLRFIDVDGDGHADILIMESDALIWYPSLAESGFGPARRVPKPADEGEGPVVADHSRKSLGAETTFARGLVRWEEVAPALEPVFAELWAAYSRHALTARTVT
jgi:hypothetical protein